MRRPMWINWVLKGLEQTLAGMKVIPHLVDEPDLYSLFVDLKRYPHPEVKKVHLPGFSANVSVAKSRQ